MPPARRSFARLRAPRVISGPVASPPWQRKHRHPNPRYPVAPLSALRKTIGLQTADVSLAALVEAATKLDWTRDPFDRLISAQAIVAGAPLLTADRTILAHLPLATWN